MLIIAFMLIPNPIIISEIKSVQICPVIDTHPEEHKDCVMGNIEDYLPSPTTEETPVYNHPQICDMFANISRDGHLLRRLTAKEKEIFKTYGCPYLENDSTDTTQAN